MESENWKGMQSGGEKDIEYFKRNADIVQANVSQIASSEVNV